MPGMSSRRSASRSFESGPWQAKQWFERMGRISRLKSISGSVFPLDRMGKSIAAIKRDSNGFSIFACDLIATSSHSKKEQRSFKMFKPMRARTEYRTGKVYLSFSHDTSASGIECSILRRKSPIELLELLSISHGSIPSCLRRK